LAEQTGVSVQVVSQHLAKMRLAGHMHGRREGRHQVYLVSDLHLAQVVQAMLKHYANDRRTPATPCRRRGRPSPPPGSTDHHHPPTEPTDSWQPPGPDEEGTCEHHHHQRSGRRRHGSRSGASTLTSRRPVRRLAENVGVGVDSCYSSTRTVAI